MSGLSTLPGLKPCREAGTVAPPRRSFDISAPVENEATLNVGEHLNEFEFFSDPDSTARTARPHESDYP